MKKCLLLLCCCWLLLTMGWAQQNRIALLDMTVRNGESTDGNKFSAEHLLKVAGLPYLVTDSVNLACQYKFILCSSSIESFSFSTAERDSLRSYLNRGGELFVTQLKDTNLFDVFGIADYIYGTKRYGFLWNYNSADPSFRWLNDVNEQSIKLGDTSYTDIFSTRSYQLSSASAVAYFDDDSVALCKNNYGSGHAFVLGINWKDLFLRNQVMASYKANRTYSNGFEPGSDVFVFYLRALYAQLNPYAVWKHTSGLNSRSSLIITHDVDATTSIRDWMGSFASFEHSNHIQGTYFITTHYMHDSIAKDFWHGYQDVLKEVKTLGHEIGSHSVSHVPDFDNESIVPEGSCGNTEFSYQPFYNGTYSSNVTVCGETEVSKLLLERDLGVSIRSFRLGYLAYNEKILNSLENNHYSFNSSHSANDVLTEFPFQGHLDLSMSGAASSILEIPNCISDVFMSDPISSSNFDAKAGIWLDVLSRNSANYAPTVLLIHPNRGYKLMAEQKMIRCMANNIRIVPFEQFGDFWLARNNCDFDYTMENDSSLLITVKNSSLPLHPNMSFVVDHGMSLASIRVETESHQPLEFKQAAWENGDKILYAQDFSADYTSYYYEPGILGEGLSVFPNPFSGQTTFTVEVMFPCQVILNIYDVSGRKVDTPVEQDLGIGRYQYVYDNPGLAPGVYFYEFSFGGLRLNRYKMVITKQVALAPRP